MESGVSVLLEYVLRINTEVLHRGSTGAFFGHFTHCIEKFDIFFKKTWPYLCDYWN